MQALPTFHESLDIIHKTMDHTQGLRNSHANLFLGQSIQVLESIVYISVPKQFLCGLLCGTLSHGLRIYNSTLTEPPLLNFFGHQGKN